MVNNRLEDIPSVQNILTEYECYIRTHFGLHETGKYFCAPGGREAEAAGIKFNLDHTRQLAAKGNTPAETEALLVAQKTTLHDLVAAK